MANQTISIPNGPCFYTFAILGLLVTIIIIVLFVYFYVKSVPVCFPSNTWYVHFLLLLGILSIFVVVLSLPKDIEPISHAMLLLSCPYTICFSCIMVLSFSVFVSHAYKIDFSNRFLCCMTIFLTLINPISSFNEAVLWTQYAINVNVYIYYLIVTSMCLLFMTCSISNYFNILLCATVLSFTSWTIYIFRTNVLSDYDAILIPVYILLVFYYLPQLLCIYKKNTLFFTLNIFYKYMDWYIYIPIYNSHISKR
ncbi:protein E48C [Elephant endotheliotropic herpesvirus 2]|nr:protein E48C [Elephant endotheliotropic herpesvirus 2]